MMNPDSQIVQMNVLRNYFLGTITKIQEANVIEQRMSEKEYY